MAETEPGLVRPVYPHKADCFRAIDNVMRRNNPPTPRLESADGSLTLYKRFSLRIPSLGQPQRYSAIVDPSGRYELSLTRRMRVVRGEQQPQIVGIRHDLEGRVSYELRPQDVRDLAHALTNAFGADTNDIVEERQNLSPDNQLASNQEH